jgi:hypothetical protein
MSFNPVHKCFYDPLGFTLAPLAAQAVADYGIAVAMTAQASQILTPVFAVCSTQPACERRLAAHEPVRVMFQPPRRK